MLFLHHKYNTLLRLIAAGVACLFLFNSIVFVDDAEALAIWSAMQRVDGRRLLEVERLERARCIKFASPGSPESEDLDRSGV
ncbi:MAG: hypothetical protein KBB52_04080, partial [Candidatus Omnitrophica bacterium]|nr:hypothetical protein [Candidatus Omnitrophota bacterium]